MGQCLKCGKKTAAANVFCDDCLTVMAQYPVKPGTVAHIPVRPAAPSAKAKTASPTAALNALIKRQRIFIRWLVILSVALAVLLLISTAFLLLELGGNHPFLPIIGRYA